jgi:hypothetical protein
LYARRNTNAIDFYVIKHYLPGLSPGDTIRVPLQIVAGSLAVNTTLDLSPIAEFRDQTDAVAHSIMRYALLHEISARE